jgi:hypothetical protein
MDFSAKLDDLQQRAAHTKAAAQAAVSESREQLRQRIDQAKLDVTWPPWTPAARLAVLDAIDARVYADELAQQGRRQ